MTDFKETEAAEPEETEVTQLLEPRYVTIREAAEFWAVSTKTIRRAINAGELTAYYPRKNVLRIDKNEMEARIKSSASRRGSSNV